MNRPRLVMVGNGMAGVRTLEELLRLAPDLYDIQVFGAEPHPNYNRILLTPVLAGEQRLEDIILNDLDWYRQHAIRLHLGKKIVRIDRARRRVIADDGSEAQYDRLLLATGSRSFIPPLPGHDLAGVIGYRDIADTRAMLDAAERYRHAVVVGGGLLGLEAANGLRQRGMQVSVVHRGEWLLDRQLDRTAGELLQRSLEARGIRFRLAATTERLLGGEDGRVRTVCLQNGERLPAELVVMATGIRPNAELAEAAGLPCRQGIRVDDTLQTFDPRIYAVGECVSHRGISYGLVAPLFEQARVCATHLARLGIGRYAGSLLATRLKVTDIDLFSAGDFSGDAGTQSITLSDPTRGIYRKLVVRNDRLVGACLFGDSAHSAWYQRLIRDGASIAGCRERLMFGEAQETRHAG